MAHPTLTDAASRTTPMADKRKNWVKPAAKTVETELKKDSDKPVRSGRKMLLSYPNSKKD